MCYFYDGLHKRNMLDITVLRLQADQLKSHNSRATTRGAAAKW